MSEFVSMIPSELHRLSDQVQGSRRQPEDVPCVLHELRKLKIDPNSEFGQFLQAYNLGALTAFGNSLEQLIDICVPNTEIALSADWVHHEVEWVPENFIPFSSLEGEGGLFYDRDTGAVWYFELSFREEFLAGERQPMFDSFFDFMLWYLGVPEAVAPQGAYC